jgi:hypothetical protein
MQLKKGCHGMRSGASLRANPSKTFPTDKECTFSYEVFFPKSFNVEHHKGGKLPGLSLGHAVGSKASGKMWTGDAGSCRVMFNGGYALGYLYLAIPGGAGAAARAQSKEYLGVSRVNSDCGHRLWGAKTKDLQFKPQAWNTVSMRVKLNTPGKRDGLLELAVNGRSKSVPVVWRSSARVKITDVNLVSFFGGSTAEYNSPNDTHVKFRNFHIAFKD